MNISSDLNENVPVSLIRFKKQTEQNKTIKTKIMITVVSIILNENINRLFRSALGDV